MLLYRLGFRFFKLFIYLFIFGDRMLIPFRPLCGTFGHRLDQNLTILSA